MSPHHDRVVNLFLISPATYVPPNPKHPRRTRRGFEKPRGIDQPWIFRCAVRTQQADLRRATWLSRLRRFPACEAVHRKTLHSTSGGKQKHDRRPLLALSRPLPIFVVVLMSWRCRMIPTPPKTLLAGKALIAHRPNSVSEIESHNPVFLATTTSPVALA